MGGSGVNVGDNQTSLPDLPGLPVPGDGGDGGECERWGEARLKVVDRAQLLLRTVDVERLIPEDHPARAIWEFVGRLDLSGYTDQVRSVAGGAGRPAFDPQLLVSLWVYSYSQAVSSARAIERLCEYHPAYQWLTGMQSIGAHTLSDFRVTHEEILNELFVQALGVLTADGLITLERVMLVGTKVRANALSIQGVEARLPDVPGESSLLSSLKVRARDRALRTLARGSRISAKDEDRRSQGHL